MIVLIISNMSRSLYNGEIEISDLLRFNPHQELIDNFIYEQKVFYKGLNELKDSGEMVIDSPYPSADLDYSKGGWVWSSFSKSQMLKRIQFEYETGLKEYSFIVETYFSTIKNEMSLYAALPARIIGQLIFESPSDDNTWNSHPVILNQTGIVDIKASVFRSRFHKRSY